MGRAEPRHDGEHSRKSGVSPRKEEGMAEWLGESGPESWTGQDPPPIRSHPSQHMWEELRARSTEDTGEADVCVVRGATEPTRKSDEEEHGLGL